MTWEVRHGDCVAVMAAMDAESVDAVVTDPPYGLEFMGKEWDRLGDIGKTSHAGIDPTPGFKGFVLPSYNGSSNRKCGVCRRWEWDYPDRKCVCDAPDFPNAKAQQGRLMHAWHEAWAREAYRVLRPGGHLLAFSGTRTYHRLASAVEDAGFEVRDMLAWMYGSGFPKSLDVGKAMDAAAGAVREVVGAKRLGGNALVSTKDKGGTYGVGVGVAPAGDIPLTAPSTDLARQWDGWGTALKPAHEPVVVARKPLRGTVAANVARYGTGALNVDGCRIAGDVPSVPQPVFGTGHIYGMKTGEGRNGEMSEASGRWPANVVLGCACDGDHDAGCAVALLDAQSGERGLSAGVQQDSANDVYGRGIGLSKPGMQGTAIGYGDTGGASRYFFVARGERRTMEAWNQDNANAAESSSSQPSSPGDSARSSAPTAAEPMAGAIPSRSTNGTQNGFAPTSEPGTQPTLSTAPRSSPGSRRRKPTRTSNPAGLAVRLALTDTTTTTAGRSISDGSAGPATYSTTQSSPEAGAAGYVLPVDGEGVRHWYTAKASRSEREQGLEALAIRPAGVTGMSDGGMPIRPDGSIKKVPQRANHHPTVKPVDLMQWLVRLVTPPGGLVLDPFVGSGSTGIAALREGFAFVGIDQDAEYVEIARHRIRGDAPLFNQADEVPA